MSFQDKVKARGQSFGEPSTKSKSKDERTKDKLSGLPNMVEPDPPPAEEPPPPPAAELPSPPAEELPISSHEEVSPGVAAALLSGACNTESARFVGYSVEDLATVVNG